MRRVIYISNRPNRNQRNVLEMCAIESSAWLIVDTDRMNSGLETLYSPPLAENLDSYIHAMKFSSKRILKEAHMEEALKIRVPPFAQGNFFQDHKSEEEFWAFKSQPKTKAGDVVEFVFGSKPVARAVVSRVESPGQSSCGHSGKFKDKWKVHWKDSSFNRISKGITESLFDPSSNVPVVGRISMDGDVEFKQTWNSHKEVRLARGHAWRYSPVSGKIYWWEAEDITPENIEAVRYKLKKAGFTLFTGNTEMTSLANEEEGGKAWNDAHGVDSKSAVRWQDL